MAVRHVTGLQDAALTVDIEDAGSTEHADSGI